MKTSDVIREMFVCVPAAAGSSFMFDMNRFIAATDTSDGCQVYLAGLSEPLRVVGLKANAIMQEVTKVSKGGPHEGQASG